MCQVKIKNCLTDTRFGTWWAHFWQLESIKLQSNAQTSTHEPPIDQAHRNITVTDMDVCGLWLLLSSMSSAMKYQLLFNIYTDGYA